MGQSLGVETPHFGAVYRRHARDKLNLERVAGSLNLIGNCPNEALLSSEFGTELVRSNARPSTEDIQDSSGADRH
jgi:hypothetical protein